MCATLFISASGLISVIVKWYPFMRAQGVGWPAISKIIYLLYSPDERGSAWSVASTVLIARHMCPLRSVLQLYIIQRVAFP